MHQPTKDHLEQFLRNPGDSSIAPEFKSHLDGCDSCQADLQAFNEQNELLRSLRVTEEVEPAPGFYARVMSQIEEQVPDSFWSVFLDPAFGKRLAYACATLVLLLGTYLVTTENHDFQGSEAGLVSAEQSPAEAADGTVQPQQRNAVLVNLVTYQE